MNATRSALTLSLLAVLASPAALRAQQDPAQVLIQRARMLDAQGRHDLAVANWQQVLLLEPQQPDGLAALANYYRGVGDTTKATYYERLLAAVSPALANRLNRAGAGAAPGSDEDKLQRAARLSAAHQYTAALALYREVFGTTPPDTWAVAYYQTEAAIPSEGADGVAGLRALAQKYPADPEYQLSLARVLTYKPSTRLEGVRMLAAFHGNARQNEQARAAWRAALLWDPAGPAAAETSKTYLDRYPDPQLAAQLQQASRKETARALTSPEEGAAYRALASGNFAEAMTRFTQLAAEPGRAARGEAGLGYVSMIRRDFPAAMAHFEKARAEGMRSPALDKALRQARYWAYMANGNQALQSRQPDRAAAEFARARDLNAQRPEAAEAMAGAMMAAQQPAQAAQILANEIRNNPERPEAWFGWMNALLASGQPDRVLAEQENVPGDVLAVLGRRADYLAILLCAELAEGRAGDSRMLLERIRDASTGDASTGADAAASEVRAAALLFRYGYFDEASRLCYAALRHDSGSVDAWLTLVQAEHGAGRDHNAIAIASRMPRSVDAAAMASPGFLITLASLYQADDQFSSAQALLDRAAKVSPAGEALPALKLQRASLALAQGDTRRAYGLYRAIADQSPGQLDAWAGMINALHTGKQDAAALAAMQALPGGVRGKLLRDPAFLETAAFVYSGTNHPRDAMLCLRAVSSYYEQEHQPVPFDAGIELAWLELNSGDQGHLAATLNRLGRLDTLSPAQTVELERVWAAWSMRRAEAAFDTGHAGQAVALLQTALRAYPADSTLQSALGSMYVRTGHAADGMKLFMRLQWNHATVDQFTSGIEAALSAKSMSYAEYWLQLGLQQYPGNAALLRAGAHVEESKGNLKAAETYLKLAIAQNTAVAGTSAGFGQTSDTPTSMAPGGVSPQGALERMLTGTPGTAPPTSPGGIADAAVVPQANGSSQAPVSSATYRPESFSTSAPENDPGGDSADSVRPAAWQNAAPNLVRVGGVPGVVPGGGTSEIASERDNAPESTSTASSNGDHPGNSGSVSRRPLAADPLAGLDLQGSGGRALDDDSQAPDSGSSLAALLDRAASSTAPSIATPGQDDALQPLLPGDAGDNPPSLGFAAGGPAQAAAPEQASLAPAFAPAVAPGVPMMPTVRSTTQTSAPTASDELANLQARYSPWLIGGGQVESHSGTAGFDRLQHYEGEIAASTVLGIGGARLSVITRPVLLQSGVPDSTSNYRFGSSGTLPQDAQFASGTGATVQLATRTTQASVGISPSGFLVRNTIGSLSVRPFMGPITLHFYRESQTDSLLSYAGMKDPATGEIWGGVVASGGALQFSRGGASSGFYASADGQKLTGLNIQNNSRILGNAGAYWLAYSNPYGDLKIGANLTAMHYARNERYFTLGQGGYFSPNAFLLMNAPISWEGKLIHDTSYTISGSLGAQNIQESAALPGSLVIGTGAESTTGASYDLHLRMAHRMDAHWTVEAFFDSNNARQYTDNSAGFTVRYSKYPQSPESAPNAFLNPADPLPLQAPE